MRLGSRFATALFFCVQMTRMTAAGTKLNLKVLCEHGQKLRRHLGLLHVGFVFLGILFLFTANGCTWHAQRVARIDARTEERVRELVQGAGTANATAVQRVRNVAAVADAAGHSNLVTLAQSAGRASTLVTSQINRAQGLIGLPAADQTAVIEGLLSENLETRQAAERAELKRANQEGDWITERNKLEEKLRVYGEKYEMERNKSVVSRIWGWGIGTFGLFGFIALCVFCPAIGIPLITRLVAFTAEMIPAAGRICGVVGTKTVGAITSAIDVWKESVSEEEAKTLTGTLAKTMDSGHKRIVADLRAAQVAASLKKG